MERNIDLGLRQATLDIDYVARADDAAALSELERRLPRLKDELDVNVERADASITVQTASGDQRIGCASSGQVSLRSASGDIWIGIRRGSGVWVDASSMSGETTSELDVGGAATGEEEGALVELRAQTMSGDVYVARAAAPSELER